ncbi:MAG: hypothetical protein IT440_03060 [Phycisphaeraceae bacterium]|nr:hypothetical protein [Phycisphaeraceae bacterium]
MQHISFRRVLFIWWILSGFGAVSLLMGGGTLRAEEAAVKQPAPAGEPALESAQKSWQDWIKSTKEPIEGWKWGADLRLRTVYLKDAIHLGADSPTAERYFHRYRARWWNAIKPMEHVEVNIRLCWESRWYGQPEIFDDWYGGTVMFDQLNVKLDRPENLPVTVVAGRQDMKLGDGWLVMDGTPLDGSRTLFFDAVRSTVHFDTDKTDLELIYIDQGSADDRLIQPLNDLEEDNIEQDERGVIAYLTNKSIDSTELNVYGMYKHMEAAPGVVRDAGGSRFNSPGDNGDLYTLGGRFVHAFNDHWTWRAEGAGQFGRKNDADLLAGGVNSRLSYDFKDARKTQWRVNYEYRGGDNPTTGKSEEFDPLWGRWPQFSELFIYTDAMENRIGETTNFHRLGTGLTFDITKGMSWANDYNILFADNNSRRGVAGFSDNGMVKGHLVTSCLRHKFNDHMLGHLLAECFVPGDYYGSTRQATATFLRAELTFVW